MISSRPSLSSSHEQRLQEVVAAIADTIRPQKIICFGMRTFERHSWSCFAQHQPSTILYGDLLVITSETEKSKREAIAQLIRTHTQNDIVLSAQVHSLGAIVMALQHHHLFFTRILSEGKVLYDKGTPLLSYPGQSNENEEQRATEHAEAILNLQRAEGFMQAATHLRTTGMHTLALFSLHQATEQASSAILKKYMGYLISTHRLTRLLELIENCSPAAADFFHRHTEAGRKRFSFLEQAYVDARYNAGYAVSHEAVVILQEQVQMFVHHASLLLQHKSEVPMR